LTSAAGESSGYQGFYVTESTNSANTARHSWKAFDMTFSNSNSDNAWANDGVNYTGTDYAYNGSANLGTGAVNGEWIKLQLPHKIRLEYMKIWIKDNDTTRIPEDWKLYGSDDNSNWTELFSKTGQGAINENLYNVNATSMYNYLAVVVTKISGQNNYFRIVELEYFGIPEYDPEAHGVNVVVKSVPNVPNTDWLEVYYDAKDLADGSTTVNDLKPSGTATNGTATNVTVSDGAFVFDGTSDIRSTVSTFTGDQPHTMSVWVNISTSHTLGDGYICVLAPSTGENVNQVSTIRYQTDGFNLQSWGNDIQMYNLGIQKGRWYHLVVVYDGGGVTTSSKRLYIDTLQNLKFSNDATTGDEIDFANTTLSLGSRVDGTSSHLTGSIANFRLFNRALTTDEIYQLYTYQKQDFGHGTLGMTLKAGRLGIGTSEPRAALDVRGDIIGGCPAFFSATRTSGTVTSPATVVFNSIQVSRGGGFNTSTGGYTVPLSGYYFIGHHSASSTTTNYQPRLRVNDVDFNNYLSRNYSSGGSTNRPVSFSLIGYLNAGDTATIYISVGVMHSTYAGFTMYYLSS
jgi:hypothetical protein